MKTITRFALMLFLLSTAAGCGDNPGMMTHDLLVFWNEVCDNMLRATDEATAKDLMKVQFKELENSKFKPLKKRFEDRFKKLEKDDDLDAMTIDNALLDYKYEIVATVKRLNNCQERLTVIIANTPGDTANLKSVRDWPNDKRVFGSISLRAFNPGGGNVDYPDFGKGLVPLRPKYSKEKILQQLQQ